MKKIIIDGVAPFLFGAIVAALFVVAIIPYI